MRRVTLPIEVLFTAVLIVPAWAAAQPTPLDPAEFQVNTYTTDAQRLPTIAVDLEGNFVVAWDSLGSNGSDTSSFSIQTRRFDADGVPIGVDFQANTYTTNGQSYPAVAVDPEGNFVVAWTSNGSSGSDTSGSSLQARRFGRPTLVVNSPSGGTGGPTCKPRSAWSIASCELDLRPQPFASPNASDSAVRTTRGCRRIT
ncbi:MAG: hypothetical protein K8J08_15680 [Thermoanaerobaculia bacterium]|nr:hypothetical protein [Thermoanaerobaculia bacterium]